MLTALGIEPPDVQARDYADATGLARERTLDGPTEPTVDASGGATDPD